MRTALLQANLFWYLPSSSVFIKAFLQRVFGRKNRSDHNNHLHNCKNSSGNSHRVGSFSKHEGHYDSRERKKQKPADEPELTNIRMSKHPRFHVHHWSFCPISEGVVYVFRSFLRKQFSERYHDNWYEQNHYQHKYPKSHARNLHKLRLNNLWICSEESTEKLFHQVLGSHHISHEDPFRFHFSPQNICRSQKNRLTAIS